MATVSLDQFVRQLTESGLMSPAEVTSFQQSLPPERRAEDGQALTQIVKERGPLPMALAVDCVLQAACGLAYAHGKGIIHRDIKPANLLLDREGTVKKKTAGPAEATISQQAAAAESSREISRGEELQPISRKKRRLALGIGLGLLEIARIVTLTMIVFALVLLPDGRPSAAQAGTNSKTPVTLEDLYRIDRPTYLVVSPDGQSAVYCREWIDRSLRAQRYALWRVEGTAAQRRPLEPGEPDARRPLLSPDGRWVAFLSTRPLADGTPAFQPVPPYSDPATDIWLIPAGGGRAIPLGGRHKPYGRVISDSFYGRVAFSPDGRRLVFVADDGRDPRTAQEIAAGVIVVRNDQGEGYTGYGPAQIWVADLSDDPGETAAARITRVTHDNFWYGDPQWAPDGSYLVVHANRTADQESVRYNINKNYNLWRIDLKDYSLRVLTDGPGPEVSPRIAPDGRRLVCLSVPRCGPHSDVYNLLVVDLGSDKPRGTVLFDHHGPDADQAPHGSPAFPLPSDCWLDDHRFVSVAHCGLESRSQVIDLKRGPEAMDRFKLPAAPDETRRQQARRRLTPPAESLWTDRLRAPDQAVRWKSFDGLAIEGVLTLPPEGIGQKPYKLLVIPHGGPHSRAASGQGFATQLFAANGYAVFQPNFRGSIGYGRKFLDANRFDFGGGDMRDILSGIDYLAAQGIADPKRQFLYGTSYGGYMTCWLVTQAHQFRAAVAQNAVTDRNVMWHTSDLQSWVEYEFGGLPWEVRELLHERSPLSRAHKVRTPTLILHAANDRRCPLPMGLAFYRVLKRQGVPTQMVIYPDEGHPIRQLPHQEDVLRRVLDWFREHGATEKESGCEM